MFSYFTEGVNLYKVRLTQNPERVYALKQVDINIPQLRKKVNREIRILSEMKSYFDKEREKHALEDPNENIVELIEVFQTSVDLSDPNSEGAFQNIVLEWVNGVTLDKKCAEEVNELAVWRVLRGILKGLLALHRYHIYHFDLHSNNILINDNNVKIIDFDHSKTYFMLEMMEERKEKNSIFGINDFIAPEVACGGIYRPAADIWAAGMNGMYLCKHGKFSFDVRGNPELQLPAQYSPQLEGFLGEMLNMNYKDRPNAAQLMSKLTKICTDELKLW